MREKSDLSYKQIADREGLRITTVETLIWRARQAFKREFLALSEADGRLAGFAGLSLIGLRGLLKRFFRVAGSVPARFAALSPQGIAVAVGGAVATAALVVASSSAPPHAEHSAIAENQGQVAAGRLASPGAEGSSAGTGAGGPGTKVPTSSTANVSSGPSGTTVGGSGQSSTSLLTPTSTLQPVGKALHTLVNRTTGSGGAGQTVGNLAGTADGVVNSVVGTVTNTVQGTINKVTQTVGNTLGTVNQTVSKTLGTVDNGVKQVVGDTEQAVTAAKDAEGKAEQVVSNTLGTLSGDAGKTGGDAPNAIANTPSGVPPNTSTDPLGTSGLPALLGNLLG